MTAPMLLAPTRGLPARGWATLCPARHAQRATRLPRLALARRVAASAGGGSSPTGGPALPDLADQQQHDHDLQRAQQLEAEQQQHLEAAAAAESAEQAVAEEYSMQSLEAAAAAAGAKAPAREVAVAAPGPLGAAQAAMQSNRAVAFGVYGVAGFLGVTFLITLGRMAAKWASPQAKRDRTINKNKLVVDEIRRYLPGNRAGLNSGAMGRLRFQTGFSAVEIFRKYLWYLLRERKFDQEAVDDLVALRAALGLSDEQVAEALRERAQRIYEKYGNVMLETEGMTKAGIQRKATTRALFAKLQYLLDCEALLSPQAAEKVSLRDIFGATEQDMARLRIVSLHEVDLERLAALPAAEEGEGGASGGEEQQQAPQ